MNTNERDIKDLKETEFINLIEGAVKRQIIPLEKSMNKFDQRLGRVEQDITGIKSEITGMKSAITMIDHKLTSLAMFTFELSDALATYFDQGEPERRQLAIDLRNLTKELTDKMRSNENYNLVVSKYMRNFLQTISDFADKDKKQELCKIIDVLQNILNEFKDKIA
jgi:archaellum component FlaC